MAIRLFLDAIAPKLATNPRQAWEKLQREPPIMATTLFQTAIAPKPATGLGKIRRETVYHGDRETKRDRIGETIRVSEI